jgi:hypothetical protein
MEPMGIEPITLRRGVAIDSDANVESGLHRMSLVPKSVRFSARLSPRDWFTANH